MKRAVTSLAGALLVTPAAAATLVVEVQNIAGDEGDVLVAVCNTSFDEAGCPIGARRPAGQASEFRFEGLALGRYAVAVFHDVNGNGELDRRPPGLPTEPYGFSNDVDRFAPPSFERALVRLDESETAVVVRLGHLFDRE